MLTQKFAIGYQLQLTDERMFCGSSTQPRSKFKSFTQFKRCCQYPIDPKM
jgi:hypothetical protein